MFKKSDDCKQTVLLLIGLAIFDFHKGIDFNSLSDPIDEKLLTDIVKEFEIGETVFMERVLHACSQLRVPLTMLHQDSWTAAMNSPLPEVQEFCNNLFFEEIKLLYTVRETMCLADFILPNRIGNFIPSSVSTVFIQILSKL